MKRVIISLFLLATVFLMSGLFTTRESYPAGRIPLSAYAASPNGVTDPPSFVEKFLPSEDCACDASAYPTVTLVLLAALASSLTMATFIYGSHFIATLVAG